MTLALNSVPHDHMEAAMAFLEERNPLPDEDLAMMTPMTWDMVQTMHRAGVIIGSHTKSHCLLPTEHQTRMRAELLGSKRILEKRLRAPVDHFAYPDGRFNPDVVELVKSAGYRFAYGNCLERDPKCPLLTIPRKMLWERACLNMFERFSPAVMNCQVHWVFDRNKQCVHNHSTILDAGNHGTIR